MILKVSYFFQIFSFYCHLFHVNYLLLKPLTSIIYLLKFLQCISFYHFLSLFFFLLTSFKLHKQSSRNLFLFCFLFKIYEYLFNTWIFKLHHWPGHNRAEHELLCLDHLVSTYHCDLISKQTMSKWLSCFSF